ncbi:PhaM family polyhydroxyalkanoate granule multifunctional regulatory protein [Diaphorobacter caeni]|uniref:PhaM family polyhydroxyalkanoate granule multifunctional regulatory protein n=1 Tax=Diaphorobacter caeni TaxID=2784387 RepID=UPI00188F494C|nr:PhaM family polyhydroxyalkanoate granule multifunctional regulatory protein [Diaphorobacter caeni]MBF5007579.1 hypothetical protein [Diaphorobacter caeni]
MSDTDNTPFGFGRFVPGFDFLQNLAKGATSGASPMPGLASWVAPTVSVEELDKRIGELKSVQFWLEQNSRALAATIQALEVQKMTLATLENMNVAMGDIAGAFGAQMAGVAGAAKSAAASASKAAKAPEPESEPKAADKPAEAPRAQSQDKTATAAAFMPGASGMVDPVQWWTSLTNQFQQIATSAMRDVSQQAANAPAMASAGGVGGGAAAQEAFKKASDMATQFAADSMKGAEAMTRSAMAVASKAAGAAKAPAAKTAAAAKKSTATSAAAKKTRPKASK